MRIGLANQPVIPHRVVLSTLITGDDTGRYSGTAHQYDKCGGVMLAESPARGKQEFIQRILAKQRRSQGIDKRLVMEIFERPLHHFTVCTGAVAPAARQRPDTSAEFIG